MIKPEVLAEHHLHSILEASAISLLLVEERGYRTVTTKAELLRLGFSQSQAIVPSLLIPVWKVNGEIGLYQSRPDMPRINKQGNPVKYETAVGARMALDVHPASRHLLADPAVPLWITEGIKKGDALASRGCCAVALLGVWNWRGTNDKGGKTALTDWESIALNNRTLYIVFDSDVMLKPAVHAALVRLKAFVESKGARVALVYLPSGASGEKVGVDDFLAAGGSVDDLVKLARSEVLQLPASEVDDELEISNSQATRLVRLAEAADLFHDEKGDAYAAFDVNGHLETWPTRSMAFRRWLATRFYAVQGKSPSSSAIADALTVIEGRAHFEGDERRVWTRVASHEGCIYLDLGDESWSAIEIKPDGWHVAETSPVHFRRGQATGALPIPQGGGSLNDLKLLINFGSEDDFRRVVGWLVGAMRPNGPYAVLAFVAEHGAGKSVAARFLRSLVDPSGVPLRGMPRDERDLVIAAKANLILALDNVSYLPQWLSDALCRMATGAGWATRRLYTDSEEELFSQSRPVLVTGIEDYVTNGDLLDRTMLLNLPTISPVRRKQEVQLERDFHHFQPLLLGAILDAVCAALRNIERVKLPPLPRMADFAAWVVAAEESLPWHAGGFLDSYLTGANEAQDVILDASAISEPIRSLSLSSGPEGWQGTATELLKAVTGLVADDVRRSKSWPTSGRGLSGMLRRLAPTLRAIGIEVEFERDKLATRRRIIVIRQEAPDLTVQTDQSSTRDSDASDSCFSSDASQESGFPPSGPTGIQADGSDGLDVDAPDLSDAAADVLSDTEDGLPRANGSSTGILAGATSLRSWEERL